MSQPNVDIERVRNQLATMYRIRAFEEAAVAALQDGDIPGPVHPSIGQEACAVAIVGAVRHDDILLSTHRGHGHTLVKGADPFAMMCELLGRAPGCCGGKGGSMHIADFGVGMLGANGIVGGGIPIATGAGLAAQMDGKDRVAVSFFGDGASNAGSFHESLNIAATWKLPMLYVCENNRYAANTAAAATHAQEDVAARAHGYDMPGVIVDGNDISAVYDAATTAVARARAGDGPTLIECKTYRWGRHTERPSQAEPRPATEVEEWRTRDPIPRLVEALKAQQGQLTDEEWEEMDREILARISSAVAYAKASAFPKPEAALDDVFSGEVT